MPKTAATEDVFAEIFFSTRPPTEQIRATASGTGYAALRVPPSTPLDTVQMTALNGTASGSAILKFTTQWDSAPPANATRAVKDAYTASSVTGNVCPAS